MKTFLDLIVDFSKINPEDIFNGFHKKFVLITQMTDNDLITAKQTLDLALKLGHELSSTQEEILMHIVEALQTQALRQTYNRNTYYVLQELYYMDSNNKRQNFHYNHEKKQILLGCRPEIKVEQTKNTFEVPSEKPRGLRGFLARFRDAFNNDDPY